VTPAERALLIDLALAIRALLAESFTGITLTRRERVKLLDEKLEALQREDNRPGGDS
jgi:hypothetical protein